MRRRSQAETRVRERFAVLCASVLVAGCAYDPPIRGDHHAQKYVEDLNACRETATAAARHAVISRGYLFLSYPISYPIEKRSAIRTCMVGKGYTLS